MVDVDSQDHQAHAVLALSKYLMQACVVVTLPRVWPHIPSSHEQVARRILHTQLEVVLEAFPSGGQSFCLTTPAMGLQGQTPLS